jgi:hypothetical protein
MVDERQLTRSLASLLLPAAIAIACLGLFWLPWHVGSETPVPGESYALGYDNKFGILALAVAIAVATLGRWLGKDRGTAIEWFDTEPRPFPAVAEAPAEYAILAIATFFWGNVLWAWGTYLVDPSWGEARGFINGMDLIAVGQTPYRDFFYNYGPATLYLPYWLSALTGGDMSFETAYLVSMVLFTAIGFAFLFALVRTLALSPRERAFALGVSLLAWAAINMGLQYTPLRFFVVPGACVLLDMAVWRRPNLSTGLWSLTRIALASATAALACLSVSPEMGIAGSAGIIGYGVPLLLAGRRAEGIFVIVGCVAANLGVLLAFPYFFLSVLAFASGGINFPIYPNAHNILLVCMALFILPNVIVCALAQPSDRRAALAMGLAFGGGMMIPAALGRCDPGHVFINTTVLATIMFGAVRAIGRRPWLAWLALYTLLFVVMLQYSYWSHYLGSYVAASEMRSFYDSNPTIVTEWHGKWSRLLYSRPQGRFLHWRSVLPYPADLEGLTNEGHVMLTAGNEGNLYLARYLKLQAELPPDYFHAYSQGAVTPEQIDQKVRESLAARFLLIPSHVLAPLQGEIDLKAYERGIQNFLSHLLLFPVRSPIRRAPYLPDTVIAKRLLEYFEPIGRYQNYAILKRKPGVTPKTATNTAQ